MAGESSSDPQRADPVRVATQQDFGRELSLLRLSAGLTVRQVARRAALPASTAGDYFAGRHLPPPSQPDVLARIVHACGGTSDEGIGQWQDAAGRPGAGLVGAMRRPRPYRGAAPYRGLAAPMARSGCGAPGSTRRPARSVPPRVSP